MIILSYNNGINGMFSECLSVELIILYGLNKRLLNSISGTYGSE